MTAADDVCCSQGCPKCDPNYLTDIKYWPVKVAPKAGDVPQRVWFADDVTEFHYYSGFGWMEPLVELGGSL